MLDFEKKALLLDRAAVLEVVSALRRYREASKKLLDERIDEMRDYYALRVFAREVADIEARVVSIKREGEPNG